MEALKSLVETLEIQQVRKADIVIPGNRLKMYDDGKSLHIPGLVSADGTAIATDVMHSHLAEKLQIPAKYYGRMQVSNSGLLAQNVNSWFQLDSRTKYLLRAFKEHDKEGAIARALLSDRYQAIDNYDVLLAALEAIKKMGAPVEIRKAEVTDRRLYLHVVCPSIEIDGEAFLREYLKDGGKAAGWGIVSGFCLSNSEVGEGAFSICPRGVIVRCNNGLMDRDANFRKTHLGARLEDGVINWSEQTRRKNYELVISQTEDAINTFLSKDYLGKLVEKIAEAHEIKLDNPIDTVQHVCKELSVTEEHKKSILDFFLTDGDHKASGVFHAITRQAQNMKPDDQFELEGKAFEMLPKIKSFDKPWISKN